MRIQAFTYRAIADSLGLTYNTVKSFCYREHIGYTSQVVGSGGTREFCKHCGKPLDHLVGSKPKTFCNDKCRYDWWKSHRHLMKHYTIYNAVCAHCGKEFESNGKNRKYCSHPCYIAARFGVP